MPPAQESRLSVEAYTRALEEILPLLEGARLDEARERARELRRAEVEFAGELVGTDPTVLDGIVNARTGAEARSRAAQVRRLVGALRASRGGGCGGRSPARGAGAPGSPRRGAEGRHRRRAPARQGALRARAYRPGVPGRLRLGGVGDREDPRLAGPVPAPPGPRPRARWCDHGGHRRDRGRGSPPGRARLPDPAAGKRAPRGRVRPGPRVGPGRRPPVARGGRVGAARPRSRGGRALARGRPRLVPRGAGVPVPARAAALPEGPHQLGVRLAAAPGDRLAPHLPRPHPPLRSRVVRATVERRRSGARVLAKRPRDPGCRARAPKRPHEVAPRALPLARRPRLLRRGASWWWPGGAGVPKTLSPARRSSTNPPTASPSPTATCGIVRSRRPAAGRPSPSCPVAWATSDCRPRPSCFASARASIRLQPRPKSATPTTRG